MAKKKTTTRRRLTKEEIVESLTKAEFEKHIKERISELAYQYAEEVANKVLEGCQKETEKKLKKVVQAAMIKEAEKRIKNIDMELSAWITH